MRRRIQSFRDLRCNSSICYPHNCRSFLVFRPSLLFSCCMLGRFLPLSLLHSLSLSRVKFSLSLLLSLSLSLSLCLSLSLSDRILSHLILSDRCQLIRHLISSHVDRYLIHSRPVDRYLACPIPKSLVLPGLRFETNKPHLFTFPP